MIFRLSVIILMLSSCSAQYHLNKAIKSLGTTQPSDWIELAQKAASLEGVTLSEFVGLAMVESPEREDSYLDLIGYGSLIFTKYPAPVTLGVPYLEVSSHLVISVCLGHL